MARLLLRDVYSADKRDSMVPPFLAILRTLFTDQNRPFCESDIKLHMAKLEKFLAPGYKQNERDFTTDLDRIMFEFIRDYRAEGMSGFAVEWLGASMTRKWEYAVMITESLASRDFSLVNRKFDEYANSLWDEYFREAVGISESVVKMKGEKLLVALFGLERQRHSAIELMQKKSAIKVIPAGNLSQLYDKIVTANRLPLLRQHAPFPDDLLHVFEVDDLPI